MSHPRFRRALVSVSDKSGLEDLGRVLHRSGIELVSTGGTSAALRSWGLPVTEVSQVTGFPEVMDGRVRTLHPNVHIGLLARHDRDDDQRVMAQFGVTPFDLVIVNLYPFQRTLESGAQGDQLIEMIDVGGPSMLRAAAKNHRWVVPIVSPSDYPQVIHWIENGLDPDLLTRRRFAAKVFEATAKYDSLISGALLGPEADQPQEVISLDLVAQLRYGENPSQQAGWYKICGRKNGLHRAEIVQGKPLSYNNLLDVDAALRAASQHASQPVCVAVKHTNPCGIGAGETVEEAVSRGLRADPVSVFGGILAVNRELSGDAARLVTKVFLECLVVPSLSAEARVELARKKDLRVLVLPPEEWAPENGVEYRSIKGGVLAQLRDQPSHLGIDQFDGQESLQRAAKLAWLTVAELKSNAIAISGPEFTLGLGMGQVNRIDAVHQAIDRWKRFHPTATKVVLASDAFFPFPDSVEVAAAAGVRWIVQPGGSVRDQEVFARAEALGVRMVVTGQRHFRH